MNWSPRLLIRYTYSYRCLPKQLNDARECRLLAGPIETGELISPKSENAADAPSIHLPNALDVAIAEVGLQRSSIMSLVCEREAAGVPQHVRVRLEEQLGGFACPARSCGTNPAVVNREEGLSTPRPHANTVRSISQYSPHTRITAEQV